MIGGKNERNIEHFTGGEEGVKGYNEGMKEKNNEGKI